MLELADELVAARLVLHRLTVLEAEIAHDREIVDRAPELAASVSERRTAIEEIARDLEAQWVDQGPLVSLWQRAVELAELAEGSGADSAEYRTDVDEARLRVETARLVTRDTLDRLCSQREALVDVLLAAPFDLPTAAPVCDDGRPEAGRRDALALIEAADAALAICEEQRSRAAAELERAARQRAELGDEAEVEARVAGLERALPEIVELPTSAPPSAAIRLQRAGLRVTVDAPA
jgi:hypothetical protein